MTATGDMDEATARTEARAARRRTPVLAFVIGALVIGGLALLGYMLWGSRAEAPTTAAEAVNTDALPPPDTDSVAARVEAALAATPAAGAQPARQAAAEAQAAAPELAADPQAAQPPAQPSQAAQPAPAGARPAPAPQPGAAAPAGGQRLQTPDELSGLDSAPPRPRN